MAASTLRQTANATMTSLSTISSQITSKALNLPQTYSNYVASNASSVSQIESALRSLTYLLPGARLQDAELASESLHSFVQLLSIYHDHLLKRRASALVPSPSIPRAPPSQQSTKPSLHARYTTFWTNSSSLYNKIATLLKMAQYTELLWEMIARRRGGERTRWRVVILLESFKAICRLILMRLTNSRPLVTPPMPLREDFAPIESEPVDQPDEFSEDELKMVYEQDSFQPKSSYIDPETGVPTPPLSESSKSPALHPTSFLDSFNMPRTGLTLPTLPPSDSVSSYLLSHVLTPDDVKPAKQLLHRLSSLQSQAAELLYILRPVIYALLMQRVARRYGYEGTKWKRHWTPWIAGISIDYFARQLKKRELERRVPGGLRGGLSALEREELKKRGWNMAWWGMRGAFYENVTGKWIKGVAQGLKGKPILDLVGGVVEDYEHLWGNYYFSTATM